MSEQSPLGLPIQAKDWTVAQLQDRFPFIAWTEPMRFSTTAGARFGLICRVCVAQHGFNASDGTVFPDRAAFDAHWRLAHEHWQAARATA